MARTVAHNQQCGLVAGFAYCVCMPPRPQVKGRTPDSFSHEIHDGAVIVVICLLYPLLQIIYNTINMAIASLAAERERAARCVGRASHSARHQLGCALLVGVCIISDGQADTEDQGSALRSVQITVCDRPTFHAVRRSIVFDNFPIPGLCLY
jgi:hypothetical protein